ncbi:F-box/LRR-repeat protein 20, related, related [Eimeria mitis]|uniref:F-box/LRR-repeat protein 20, related, related n=1 Tax=Eimeria mitis TaxID=44415 RepID=U6K7C2_9EIME|nr:F-box/LRR-repeat protein 20, related, related [Eimeria mitis]CDJ32112.1 F-box/LRR-repeat protein 20, related, related [Eimeria mitis]
MGGPPSSPEGAPLSPTPRSHQTPSVSPGAPKAIHAVAAAAACSCEPSTSYQGPPEGPPGGPHENPEEQTQGGAPEGPPNEYPGGPQEGAPEAIRGGAPEGPPGGPLLAVEERSSQGDRKRKYPYNSCDEGAPEGPPEGAPEGPPEGAPEGPLEGSAEGPLDTTNPQEAPAVEPPSGAGGPPSAAGGPPVAAGGPPVAAGGPPVGGRGPPRRGAFHEAACTALKNVTSIGDTARVLLTDEQLRVLLKRCTNLKTLELDGFLLTPKGLRALQGAPLEGLALAGIETKDDAFLEALKDCCKGLRSFGFVCYGGEKFTEGALKGLGSSLEKLHTAQIEAKRQQVADVLVDAVVAAAAPTLTSLTVGGVTEGCALRIAQRVGSKLHTFGYTRLNLGGAPVNDSLLSMCAVRMGALTTLRLADALTPKDLQGAPGGPHHNHGFVVLWSATAAASLSGGSRTAQASPRGLLCCGLQQQPLVSAEGLARLRPLLGKLKVLSLSRSCGLPFAVLSDIDCMVLARSLSSSLQELELNGLHGVSDAFLHEALDACGSGASAEAPGGPPVPWGPPAQEEKRCEAAAC